MAGPITWRNVTGAETGANAGLRGYGAAADSINAGFGAFQKVIGDTEKFNAGVIARQQEAERQGYLNTLQGARTPEELAAMRAQLDTQFAALPTEVQAQVRGAADARLTGLRQDVNAERTYNNAQRDAAEAPIRDSIMADIVGNNFVGAAEKMSANPGLQNMAGLQKAMTDQQTGLARQGKDDLRFTWESEKQVRDAEAAKLRMDADRLTLSNAQRTADQQATTERTRDEVGAASLVWTQGRNNLRSQITDVAKELKIPMNDDGSLKTIMDSKDRTRLDATLKERGIPLSSSLDSGDTEAWASAKADIVNRLKLNPVEAAALDSMSGAFATTRPNQIGVDKETSERVARLQQLQEDEQAKYVAMPATQENLDKLLLEGNKIIDQMTEGYSDSRRESYKEQLAKSLQSGGFKKKNADGQEVTYLPNVDTIKTILQGTTKNKVIPGIGLLRNNDLTWRGALGIYTDDINKSLRDWANSPAAGQGALLFETSSNRKRLVEAAKANK